MECCLRCTVATISRAETASSPATTRGACTYPGRSRPTSNAPSPHRTCGSCDVLLLLLLPLLLLPSKASCASGYAGRLTGDNVGGDRDDASAAVVVAAVVRLVIVAAPAVDPLRRAQAASALPVVVRYNQHQHCLPTANTHHPASAPADQANPKALTVRRRN
eukprot:GHRQ01027690.1.p2 GENE.GHRQ01027690.1~~GHRQ01027690.1.p2  ORF type:complete len:162 (-),score=34.45 GHRQ01027690.1:154-639(-)